MVIYERFFRKFYATRMLLACGILCFYVIALGVSHATTFEFEVRGTEHESLDRETRDSQNREAAERVNNGDSTDRRDVERSIEYDRDHGV